MAQGGFNSGFVPRRSFYRQDTAPDDTAAVWIDTTSSPPVAKTYNPSTSVWESIGNTIDGTTILKNAQGEIEVPIDGKTLQIINSDMVVAQDNKVYGDFETDIGEWTFLRGSDADRDNTRSKKGQYSIRAYANNTNSGYTQDNGVKRNIDLAGLDKIVAWFYVRNTLDSGEIIHISLNGDYDETNETLVSIQDPPTGKWIKLEADVSSYDTTEELNVAVHDNDDGEIEADIDYIYAPKNHYKTNDIIESGAGN